LPVGEAELVEGDGAEPGVIDVGGERSGDGHGPDGAGDEPVRFAISSAADRAIFAAARLISRTVSTRAWL
jgi:hypothetical protein